MLSRRTSLLAALAVPIALALGAPAARAATFPAFRFPSPAASYPISFPAGGKLCGPTIGVEGQGPASGNEYTVCGFGLTFVGPATSLNTVIGPTIISPGFAGTVVVAGGNVAGQG